MANLNVTVQDGNNINVEVTPTAQQTIVLDRGVSGVGIESVAIVFVDPLYYLEFTYTNGTTEIVPLPAVATGVTSFNTRIGVVTLTSNDVTTALLANSIANSKLVSSSITVNGAVISLGGSVNVGTVTSVSGTGTVNGITLSGTVTSSGNLTLNGTLSGVNLATQVTGTLSVANGGTGITSLGAGVATFLGTPTSANLAAAVTNETGTGALVFATSPTLVTPALGTPSSGVVTNLTGTASINTNGTVGATTPNTGAFTTLSSTGNTTLGDATADFITANARFNTDLVPSTDDARDLGTAALKWKQLFATTFTENGSPVVVQTDIGTDPNEIPLNQYLGDLAFQNANAVVIKPVASATPAGIGEMVFQLTSNTSLVIKVKGSDGTIRSTTLTLA